VNILFSGRRIATAEQERFAPSRRRPMKSRSGTSATAWRPTRPMARGWPMRWASSPTW